MTEYKYFRVDETEKEGYSLNGSVFFRVNKEKLSGLEILSINPVKWEKVKIIESTEQEIMMMLNTHKFKRK